MCTTRYTFPETDCSNASTLCASQSNTIQSNTFLEHIHRNTFIESSQPVLNQLKVPNRKGLFGRVKFPALEVLNFLLWTCYQAHSSRFLPTLSPYSPFILRSNWGKKTCLIEGIITSKSVEDILPTLTCPFQTQDAASRKRSTSSTKRRNWIRNTPR